MTTGESTNRGPGWGTFLIMAAIMAAVMTPVLTGASKMEDAKRACEAGGKTMLRTYDGPVCAMVNEARQQKEAKAAERMTP